MKKIKTFSITVLATVLSVLLLSCGSTKVEKVEVADTYEDAPVETADTETNTEKTTENKTKEEKKPAGKNNNAFLDFFTYGNKNEILPFDTSAVFTPKVFGGLYQQPTTILIHLKDKTAGFGSKYQAAYYILQFSDESRKNLKTAVESYLADFENKRLERKNRNSTKAYGKTPVQLYWGTVPSSTPNNGKAELKMGYTFKDNSPYFIISCPAIDNEYYKLVGQSAPQQSMDLKFYFNKNLAKDLVEKLSDENVNRYFADIYESQVAPQSGDEY